MREKRRGFESKGGRFAAGGEDKAISLVVSLVDSVIASLTVSFHCFF